MYYVNKKKLFLKSKCYCYDTTNNIKTYKTLKGISKASVANQIIFQDYKNTLFNSKIKTACNYRLNSKKHKMQLKEEHKLALDPFDDKRKILPDGITTSPF